MPLPTTTGNQLLHTSYGVANAIQESTPHLILGNRYCEYGLVGSEEQLGELAGFGEGGDGVLSFFLSFFLACVCRC